MSHRQYKDTKAISITVNLLIVLWTGYSLYRVLCNGLDGNMSGRDLTVFKYYTINSNCFAAVSALVMLFTRVFKAQPRSFATNLKYYGTCTVTITMLTVLAFLGPSIGYMKMFRGENLYFHLLGPLFAIISFCFLDRGPRIQMRHVWKSLVPTAIYAMVYAIQVLVLKKWADFYGFTGNGHWYISLAAIITGAFVTAVILKALHNDK